MQKNKTALRQQGGIEKKLSSFKFQEKYTMKNLDRDLFFLRAKSIQRQIVRSMRRLAFLYKGGSSL